MIVAEEPAPFGHQDIGRYFKEFAGTHYIPNDELEQEYPEDGQVRNSILRKHGLIQ